MHKLSTAFLAAGALALSGAALAADDKAEGSGRKLSTSLTGAAEVPGPGDPDGTGSFSARLNPGQTQLCYELTVSGVDAPSAAHIHEGATGVAGPPVVTLAAPTDGSAKECADVERDLATKLIQTPQNYYVNVHNAAHPAGAVRGQLAKGK